MALSIKTDEADALARDLAAITHESITQAVTVALRERLDRVRGNADIRWRLERLSAEYTSHPVVDDRTPDEIIAYDEHGLPT
jgi:antitoxin VapB